MKRTGIISMQTQLHHGLRKALTVMFAIGIFAAVFPTTALGQEFGSLPPLSEAALKFSPGNLVSETLKRDLKFVLLNELLMTDELILKQLKLMDSKVVGEVICAEAKFLVKEKRRIVFKLVPPMLPKEEIRYLDKLIVLELIDDLLIVQQNVRETLPKGCFSRTEIMEFGDTMDKQVKVLVEMKKSILGSE